MALPEENGIMIFTGSTVVDQQQHQRILRRTASRAWSRFTPGHSHGSQAEARVCRRRTSPTATTAAEPGRSTPAIRC